MIDDDLMTRLRRADPVAGQLTDDDRREARVLLQRVLDAPLEAPAAHRSPRGRPRAAPSGRRRRSRGLVGAAAVLAIALFVAVASIDRGPGVAERAYAAITKPDFFHVITRSRALVPDPDHLERPPRLEQGETESWYDAGRRPAYHNVQYRLRDGRRTLLAEFAGDRTGSRGRLPGSGLGGKVTGPDGVEQVAQRYDPTAEFKAAYRHGKVRDDGVTMLDGRRVRRLVVDDSPRPALGGVRVSDSRSIYFVDAETLYPVRYTTTAVISSSAGRQRITATIDYTTFETLPRTPANSALLALGARAR